MRTKKVSDFVAWCKDHELKPSDIKSFDKYVEELEQANVKEN